MRSLLYGLAAVSAVLLPSASGDLIEARNPTGNFNKLYLESNYQNGAAAPGAAGNDAGGQGIVIGGAGGGDDNSQSPKCNTIFIGTANVGGSQTAGWTSTPELVGFNVDRNVTYGSATMPLYVESGKDLTKVKRVLITQPGAPRDTWKYVNLFRNSLICAVGNPSMAVGLEDVLVAAPIWLGASDRKAGAGTSSDLYFGDSSWSTGTKSQGPGSTSISTFQVMDDVVSHFADMSKFPAVTSIIVVGHSLGASFTQRYAMARNANASTEALVQYWVGNPGAYVWPSADRPITPTDTSCASTKDDWAYGVGGGLPSYFGSMANDAAGIYKRYRSRTIQYALGTIDNEAGDTHCEAQYQGSSHLTRGQNMEAALKGMAGGLPTTQSFNMVANVAHQDYLMMADTDSQKYLFVQGLNQARPQGTVSVTITSGSSSGKNGTTSSSGSNSSGSSSSVAGSASSASHITKKGMVEAFSLLAMPIICSIAASI